MRSKRRFGPVLSELQASLTDEQLVLLATVAAVYLQHGRWPNWAWVDVFG